MNIKWHKLTEEKPPVDMVVLISDGTHLAVSSRYHGTNIHGGEYEGWNSKGFGGPEWDWDFEPTHWAEITFALPIMS